MATPANESSLLRAEYANLESLGRALRPHYRKGLPFPHIVFDQLFAPAALAAALAELPETTTPKGCSTLLSTARRTADHCFQTKGTEYKKSLLAAESSMGPTVRALLALLRSQRWIGFLEAVSGIPDLVADPQFYGGGVHLTGRDGYLQLHADFNRLGTKPVYYRRVNTVCACLRALRARYQPRAPSFTHRGCASHVPQFVYLNPDWPDEYGGHLELWDRSMTRCERRTMFMARSL